MLIRVYADGQMVVSDTCKPIRITEGQGLEAFGGTNPILYSCIGENRFHQKDGGKEVSASELFSMPGAYNDGSCAYFRLKETANE